MIDEQVLSESLHGIAVEVQPDLLERVHAGGRRRIRRRRLIAVAGVVAVVAAIIPSAIAIRPSAGSHRQPLPPAHHVAPARTLAGGVLRAVINGHAMNLTVTEVSRWDVSKTMPKCLAPPAGEQALIFDINWQAASTRTVLPDAVVSIGAPSGPAMKVPALDHTCQRFSDRDFQQARAESQFVLGGVLDLPAGQRLNRLRVAVDFLPAQIRLAPECHPISSTSKTCAQYPLTYVAGRTSSTAMTVPHANVTYLDTNTPVPAVATTAGQATELAVPPGLGLLLSAAEARSHHVKASAYRGMTGQVRYAVDAATGVHWATGEAKLVATKGPALASENDGGAFQLYRQLRDGSWREFDIGMADENTQCVLGIPVDVSELWHWNRGGCTPSS